MAEEPFEPTIGRGASLLVNIPAHIALDRSYLAQLRGDGEATAAFAARAVAELGEDEWMLRSIAHGLLAVAEWLHGRLGEAEHAFASSIAGWRAASQPTVTAWGGYQLSQVQRAPGEPVRGRRNVPGGAGEAPNPAGRLGRPRARRTWA